MFINGTKQDDIFYKNNANAKKRMKFDAYQQCSDMTFEVPDLVYLNLQPY